MDEYFKRLQDEAKSAHDIAAKARTLGLDPSTEVEVPFAADMAERVEGLVGPPGISKRIRELVIEQGAEGAALQVAKEIAEGGFGSFESQDEACEQALRTSLGILTEGIVAAPLEGIVKATIKKNTDGSDYLAIYFAGPIRSAGGSAQALAVLTGDYIRRAIGLARYKPLPDEVERFAEETDLYHDESARLQYHPKPQEVRNAVRNIPVEITGESTDKVEVSGYRDLERIETNQLRGGAVLVLAEGVLQKAPKVMKFVDKFDLDGWDWMREYTTTTASDSSDDKGKAMGPNPKFIQDLIAGRPVIGHPSEKGALRLRYGRCRTSGFAAMSMHPATMVLLDDFIAIGTQMKTERPGKGTAVSPCDTIEGPLVKLRDGSVIRVDTTAQAREVRPHIRELLFLGDLLVNYGDFLENNHPLMPAGYCEEWWVQDLEKAVEKGSQYERFFDPLIIPTPVEALEISKSSGVPLHPRYTYYYPDLDKDQILALAAYLSTGRLEEGGIYLEITEEKRLLELCGVPHTIVKGQVVVHDPLPLLASLGLHPAMDIGPLKKALDDHGDMVQALSSLGIPLKNRAPTYIGSRMGRPEKAKERRMSPPVTSLFPIGQNGGRTRDVRKASQKEFITVDVARMECPKCKEVTHAPTCPDPECGTTTKATRTCIRCATPYSAQVDECKNPSCQGAPTNFYTTREIPMKEIYGKAIKKVGTFTGDIKGVIGMTSAQKIPEPLEKGILRSKHKVYVFKDGTTRFDSTDVPLTHFRPREIGTPAAVLRELGYDQDIHGKALEEEDQLLELKCQDILINDEGGKYFSRVSQFVDDLLVKVYGMEPFYNCQVREDLVGHLILGLAPHTSAAILGRIIGFTHAAVGYAHPYFHAAKRRNCDGDEDAVFLLMDALLNFSKSYLPSTRGGKMDAPLVLTTLLDPREVDGEAHNIDIVYNYPLEFYEAAEKYAHPKELKAMIETVSDRLGKPEVYQGLGFTHDTRDINAGPRISAYKSLGSMMDKMEAQLALASKIRAVDERDVAHRVIASHFLPDLAGNLRSFSKQTVRCVECNAKYRRVPLSGRCTCAGNNVRKGKLVLTVYKGSVQKYLQVTKDLIDKYELEDYLRQRVKILEVSIASVFEEDGAAKQVSLGDFL